MTPDALHALGLWDPAAPGAAERLALLQYLLVLGATAAELVEFAAEPASLALVLALRGDHERLTRTELAARTGLPEAFLAHTYRAAGFADPGPSDSVFTDEYVEAFQTIRAAEALVGPDGVAHLTRVVGSSMARIADAFVAAFLVNVRAASGSDELALARANVEAAGVLPAVGRVMELLLRQHIVAARRPPHAGSPDGWTQRLAIGFVDLVGSTALAQELTVHELNEALATFEQRAADTVTAHGGRLVKLIGDEAMFAFSNPRAACEVALRLAEAFSADALLPPVRTGIAWGDVLSRDGDHYGPVVHLAARAVKLARPGTVLVSAELAGAVGEAYRTLPIPPRRLRGFDGRVPLCVLRRV